MSAAECIPGVPFKVTVPLSTWFEKSAPKGKRRRIGGIVSTETKDRQQEVLLQRGLDFRPFVKHGWFNDNHDRATDAIVGYPDRTRPPKLYRKGEPLPNGKPAPANCHWAEGYLLEDDERADKIWRKAKSLRKAGRSLGFSVEGKVHKRLGEDRRTVASATVTNIAVTGAPVNTETELEVLAKSLDVVEHITEPLLRLLELAERASSLDKALVAGQAIAEPPGSPGEGFALRQEALGTEPVKKKKKGKKKKIAKAEAVELIRQRFNVQPKTAARILGLHLRGALAA